MSNTKYEPIKVGDTLYLDPWRAAALPDGTKVSRRLTVTKVTPRTVTTDDGSRWSIPTTYPNTPVPTSDFFREFGSGESHHPNYARREPLHTAIDDAEFRRLWAEHIVAGKAKRQAALLEAIDEEGAIPALLSRVLGNSSASRFVFCEVQEAYESGEHDEPWDKVVKEAFLRLAAQYDSLRRDMASIAREAQRALER